jgi:hypothetical protein
MSIRELLVWIDGGASRGSLDYFNIRHERELRRHFDDDKCDVGHECAELRTGTGREQSTARPSGSTPIRGSFVDLKDALGVSSTRES